MNPLEIIENGITNGDWEMVCRGYEDLTGKVIKTKGISVSSDQLIKQIEKLINNYKNISCTNPTPIVEPIINISKRGGPEPKNFRPNTSPLPLVDEPLLVKKGYYGNTTKLLTEDVLSEEINENIEKAAITNERKTKRSPVKKYNIKCSQCEQTFESDRQESKDFGQKCPRCLRDTINGKINE